MWNMLECGNINNIWSSNYYHYYSYCCYLFVWTCRSKNRWL